MIPYRTLVAVLVMGIGMVGALALTIHYAPNDFGARIYEACVHGLEALAVVQGTRSLGAHLAEKGGIRGAVKALLTESPEPTTEATK